jgi:hypothetical protein
VLLALVDRLAALPPLVVAIAAAVLMFHREYFQSIGH